MLWSFGIFCGRLVYFVVVWCIFQHLGKVCQRNLAALLLNSVIQLFLE
jgi:hypothetical protein